MNLDTFRIHKGTLAFMLLVFAALMPGNFILWCLYGLGAINIVSLLTLFLMHRKQSGDANEPAWAKTAMAPLGGYLKFNILLLSVAMVVLWQFKPLWGGA